MTTSSYPFGPGFQHIYPVPFPYYPMAYTFRGPYAPSPYFWPLPERVVPYTGGFPGYPGYPGYSDYPAYPAYAPFPAAPYPGIAYDAPYSAMDPTRVEPTPKGFQIKLQPTQEKKFDHANAESVNVENIKVENIKAENVKAEKSQPGVKMNTAIEVGGKHGAGFQAETQVDKHGVSNQVASHVGAEQYGLNVQGGASLDGKTKGLQFETESKLGGKYGIQVHAEGHAGLQQGIGLNTEAQVLGDHGIGAHVKGQLGGGQGAAFSTGAQIGGDHGLGAHAGAQVGGGQGVSFNVGGNVGSHDGQVGFQLGGKEKKKAEE
ncbi:hypothetical protein RJP21_00915 [Paenibacillus sp. VCA1]|uniref:hypothetical protein n=1 Tax=Paenibacillus sp. VCA1 TaxID=3039148 RepID=UPI002871657D|nr:hypothetical protein [Paenibacillus sp. VCA1]MDR9852156.1 hypothetical protein [Paenibacillus sp. VCA1]